MRTKEITKAYMESKPLTNVEFKKVLDQQYCYPEIVNDLLRIINLDLQGINGKTYIALMNAVQLGIIIGKRRERSRKKVHLFTPSSSIEIKKQQISTSVKMWRNMNEWELLDVITELKAMTKENSWYQVKENLLSQARSIYYHNFIREETHE